MSGNWAMNLDMLAQEGVINFDAPSYVMGQKPRYVGNPKLKDMQPLHAHVPEAPLIHHSQPEVDEFHHSTHDKNFVKNPTWKKWLFGIVAAGTLIFGGYKFRKTIVPWIKKAGSKTGTFFKTGWNKFIGLFKKKP